MRERRRGKMREERSKRKRIKMRGET